MLESEAKTKWCPEYQSDGYFDTRFVTTDDNRFTPSCSCLDAQCACWVDPGYDMDAGERTGRCGLARNG